MGVPASMADVKASYSIGSASDWFILITETCIPTGEKICVAINRVLRRQSGLNLRASLNWDEHPVIQSVRRERADTAQKYFQMGVPLKALNDYLDLELPVCPEWEKGYLPFNLAPVAATVLPEKDGTLAEHTDDTIALSAAAKAMVDKMREALGPVARLKAALAPGLASAFAKALAEVGDLPGQRGLPLNPNLNPNLPGLGEGVSGKEDEGFRRRDADGGDRDGRAPEETTERPESELAQWRELMGQRREMTKAFASRFNRELMKARMEALRKVEGKTPGLGLGLGLRVGEEGGNVFDLELFARGLAAGLRTVAVAALQTAGEQFFAEIGRTETFVMPKERAAAFLLWREARWRAAAETIHQEIMDAVATAGETGRGEAVRARFNEISKGLAGAATEEMGCVYGLARDAAMQQAGVTSKRWLSSGHERARASHLEANGQVAPVAGAFTVDGEKLRYPCDENGAAGNTARCQCVAVAGAGYPMIEGGRQGRAGTPLPAAARTECAPCQSGLGGMSAIDSVATGENAALKRGERKSSHGSTESRPTVAGERLVRMIHPEARIVDAGRGIVDYIASDESIDSYREIIRASGWRFHHFAKNAPFVDSHDYSTIEKCLGRVVDFRVEGGKLIERVQWAIDVPENKLAQIGWKMTQAGYLKAVSVGFFPVKYVTPNSGEGWAEQLKELGLPPEAPVRTIYTEQEQVELSCCVVGSNPNALAKAYQAGAIDDADIETLSMEYSRRENAGAADSPALAARASEQARRRFVEKLQELVKQNCNDSGGWESSAGETPTGAGGSPALPGNRNNYRK
jgi:hypothetical protein